jgi:hypothetical protein
MTMPAADSVYVTANAPAVPRASFGGKGILEAGERRVDAPSRKRKQIRSHMSLLASGQFGRTVSDYDNWVGAQRRSSWRFGCLPWFKANDGR